MSLNKMAYHLIIWLSGAAGSIVNQIWGSIISIKKLCYQPLAPECTFFFLPIFLFMPFFLYLLSFIRYNHYLWVFHTSFSKWLFTGVWATASFLRTLLSIQPNLLNAVVSIDSNLPLIFRSFIVFSKSLGTVLSTPTPIGIIVTFIFKFFSVLTQDPSSCLSFCFSIIFHCGQQEPQNPPDDILFFFLLTLDLVFWPRLGDTFLSKNPKEYYEFLFLGWFGLVSLFNGISTFVDYLMPMLFS